MIILLYYDAETNRIEQERMNSYKEAEKRIKWLLKEVKSVKTCRVMKITSQELVILDMLRHTENEATINMMGSMDS